MSHTTRDQADAQRRRAAVKMYRAGTSAEDVARKLHRSRSWVYKWVRYRAHHPWTRFRSASCAPRSHPTRTPVRSEQRIVRLRQQLVKRTQPRLRFAPVGARTIHREWRTRYEGRPPSLSTIQRVLRRHRLTALAPRQPRSAYRPHPVASYPDAVHATDIITRWISGGAVVQTFNTVDVYSNDAFSTTQATKTATAACQHLLRTWQKLGVPDLAQFDNESAFSGGRQQRGFSAVVRLCLYFGIEVLLIPLGEADYNWPVETFNHLWAKQFWNQHHFTRRCDIPRVQRAFLRWYRTDYIAPRQSDTPARLRRGYRLHCLPTPCATAVPDPLPLCAGQVHTVRRVSEAGWVTFLNEPFLIGRCYRGRYVWLTLDTARQRLTVWYQAHAEAQWQWLKDFEYRLDEPVVPVPKQFSRLHA
jgi:hypothetical protein